MTPPIKIRTVRLTEYGKIHWDTRGKHTCCGRSMESAVGYSTDRVHDFADLDDDWCKQCASAWWMAIGSKGGASVR